MRTTGFSTDRPGRILSRSGRSYPGRPPSGEPLSSADTRDEGVHSPAGRMEILVLQVCHRTPGRLETPH